MGRPPCTWARCRRMRTPGTSGGTTPLATPWGAPSPTLDWDRTSAGSAAPLVSASRRKGRLSLSSSSDLDVGEEVQVASSSSSDQEPKLEQVQQEVSSAAPIFEARRLV